MWVSVEAAVLPVESTVDRLRPRVWVWVEAAVFSVDGIREWQYIGCGHMCGCVRRQECFQSIRQWTGCGHACGCQWRRLSCQSTAFESGSGSEVRALLWVSVEAGVLSVDPTVDRLRPRVWVSVAAAVLSVDGIREGQYNG